MGRMWAWACDAQQGTLFGHPFCSAENPVSFFTFPEMTESTSSSIGEEKSSVSFVEYIPPLYNIVTYSLSHRLKLHYNLLAAAVQYMPIPSPCCMNMKYIMKHNTNRQDWELPIHQCSARWCLGCSLEQILQRWIQTDVAQFSIKWEHISLALWVFKYLLWSQTAPIKHKCTFLFSNA